MFNKNRTYDKKTADQKKKNDKIRQETKKTGLMMETFPI